MQTQGITARGPPSTAPAFLFPIKIAIIVLSLVILALSAFAISVFGQWAGYVGGYSGVGGLNIFVVIKTWIVYGVFMFLEFKAPQHFYRVIAIVLYTISIIFWLSAWAWSANLAAFWLSWDDVFSLYDNNSLAKKEGGALAACAGLGALVWVLCIVHLVFFVRACLSDHEGTAVTTTTHQAELGHVPAKQAEATQYPVASPAPVQYQAQPVYHQQPGYPPQQHQQAYPAQ